MGQGYVYVNDVRYSNIFTFAVGIFFVNASQSRASTRIARSGLFFCYGFVFAPERVTDTSILPHEGLMPVCGFLGSNFPETVYP